MSGVLKKEVFGCAECSKSFDTEAEAVVCVKKCERKKRRELIAKKREELRETYRHSIRLEAGTMADVKRLLVEYAAKFFGVKLTITQWNLSYREVRNSHGAPIGRKQNWSSRDNPDEPTHYRGFSGRVEGRVEPIEGKYKPLDSSDRLEAHDIFGSNSWGKKKGFHGFHTGTGSYGSSFSGELYFFIDDFPKMKEQHDEYLKLKASAERLSAFEEGRCNKVLEHLDFVLKTDSQIETLKDERELLNKRLSKLNVEIARNQAAQAKITETHLRAIEEDAENMWATPDDCKYDSAAYAVLRDTFRGGY